MKKILLYCSLIVSICAITPLFIKLHSFNNAIAYILAALIPCAIFASTIVFMNVIKNDETKIRKAESGVWYLISMFSSLVLTVILKNIIPLQELTFDYISESPFTLSVFAVCTLSFLFLFITSVSLVALGHICHLIFFSENKANNQINNA